MLKYTNMKKTGVYIHFPFCKRKCFYCHFLKYDFEPGLAEQYVNTLIKEIRLRAGAHYIVETIYFGGGSPSLLSGKQTAAIMAALRKNFELSPNCEITVEMNPEDVEREKLSGLQKLGVNRLSLGVQSFAARDLTYLKRTHSREQSLFAVEEALNAGFTSLNLDFIVSLPGQDRKSLEQNFLTARQYKIPHISAYLLEGVHEKNKNRKEQRDHDFYFFSRDLSASLGYRQYEVSNFARGRKNRSKHNLKYWQNKEYMGFGLGASGYEAGLDYKNTTDIKDYFEKIAADQLPRGETKKLAHDKRRIVMGLRLLEGIPASNFKNYPRELKMLLDGGLLSQHGGRIAVNPDKILLLNEILNYFV